MLTFHVGRTQGPGPGSLEDREGTINLMGRRSGPWGDHDFGVALWWDVFCSDVPPKAGEEMLALELAAAGRLVVARSTRAQFGGVTYDPPLAFLHTWGGVT